MQDKIDRNNRRDLDKDYIQYMKVCMMGRQNPAWWATNILGVNLYPMQEKIMNDFYWGGYKELDWLSGMRSGKSVLSSIMGTYEYWLLDTMENPADYYGLMKNQLLFVMCIAPSSKQAEDTLFSNMQNFVERSEWFNTWSDSMIKSEEVVNKSKNIGIKILSSQASTGVGRTNKCVVFDEIASFEDTTSKRGAWEVYSRIRKSTDTLKGDGHVIAISSAQRPDDIMMTLYQLGLERDDILAVKTPTWVANPNFTEEQLREEYKNDYGTFLRDYACEPSGNTTSVFPVSVDGKPRILFNYNMDNKLETLESEDRIQRVLAIDPAVRNDGFGMACGYKEGNHYVIDGVTRFMKTEGEAYISPSEVRDLIMNAVVNLNIDTLIFDIWMYPELIEILDKRMGVECIKHIVRFEDYKRWVELQEGHLNKEDGYKLDIVFNEVLFNEAKMLIVKNIDGNPKVDHRANTTKDVSDCICNVLWHLTNTGDRIIYKPAIPLFYTASM